MCGPQILQFQDDPVCGMNVTVPLSLPRYCKMQLLHWISEGNGGAFSEISMK